MQTSTHSTIRVLVLRGDSNVETSVDPSATASNILRHDPMLRVTTRTVAADQATQLATRVRPDVILLEAVDNPVDMVSQLDDALGDTPVLVLLEATEQDRAPACVVAGARGCVVRPFDLDALVETILQVHDKATRRRQLQAQRPAQTQKAGHLVAVRGTKGGVGATAIATNLAVSIQRGTGLPTVLVDGHLFGADVPAALNVVHARSVADLVPHLDRLDDDLINTTLAKHASGISVLAAPTEFEQAESIRASDFHRVLDALRSRFAYVVVDCAPSVDQITLTAMDMADTFLLITTPEIAALKNAARVVQLGMRLGYSEQKMRLVVNRFDLPWAIAPSEFEHHLEYRTSFRLPNDTAVGRALTRGEPLVVLQAGSPGARALNRLARTVVENRGWEGQPRPARRGLLSVLGWRPFARSKRPALHAGLEAA